MYIATNIINVNGANLSTSFSDTAFIKMINFNIVIDIRRIYSKYFRNRGFTPGEIILRNEELSFEDIDIYQITKSENDLKLTKLSVSELENISLSLNILKPLINNGISKNQFKIYKSENLSKSDISEILNKYEKLQSYSDKDIKDLKITSIHFNNSYEEMTSCEDERLSIRSQGKDLIKVAPYMILDNCLKFEFYNFTIERTYMSCGVNLLHNSDHILSNLTNFESHGFKHISFDNVLDVYVNAINNTLIVNTLIMSTKRSTIRQMHRAWLALCNKFQNVTRYTVNPNSGNIIGTTILIRK